MLMFIKSGRITPLNRVIASFLYSFLNLGEEKMLPILILLYVLDTGNIIPTECYIAAWIFTIIQLIGGIYEWKKMKGGEK